MTTGIGLMELFKEFLIIETQKASAREVAFAIDAINDCYREWKKTKRRKNAVDIIMTCANKLSKIDPNVIPLIHEAGKLKLATVLMRCMDIPCWKTLDSKGVVYKKIYPLLNKMQDFVPNTGTGGTLRDIVMTRLSAAICAQDEDSPKQVFVGYEPKIQQRYLRYIFGEERPEKTFKMQGLTLPDEYDRLVKILQINHDKAKSKFQQ